MSNWTGPRVKRDSEKYGRKQIPGPTWEKGAPMVSITFLAQSVGAEPAKAPTQHVEVTAFLSPEDALALRIQLERKLRAKADEMDAAIEQEERERRGGREL